MKDTGIGLTDNDKEKLFGKFVRGEGVLQIHPDGTGLGLFITKHFVEMMHGKAVFDSPGKGKGSTFTIVLKKAL